MSKVYEIAKYALIGVDLFTCIERPDLEMREVNGQKKYFHKDGSGATVSHLWGYSTIPKIGAIDPKTENFMPYTATVIEDLPSSCKGLTPKRYEGCKLMVEKHGGYLQFWHEPTKKILRIALNSHYYEPEP